MDKHISVVGALHIGFGIFGILTGIFLFILLAGIGAVTADETAFMVLSIVGTFIGFMMLILSVPGIIGGIGLIKRKCWARILVIILSAINLINFPIGTAVGAYSLWVLLQDEVKDLLT